jgi:ubiquinone/menaquinone biosynthesis C-methylase UbiE
MHVNNASAFDTIAADYDFTFSQTLTGRSQRRQSHKWLSAFLQDKQNLRILEINCGTGDDAVWLASLGHQVIATDGAIEMIKEAKIKSMLLPPVTPVEFIHCSFKELKTTLSNKKFDLIFSNFSGLNCIPAHELSLLNDQLYDLLNPGGHLAVVIFGKYSWWETAYYLLKLNPAKASRRWRKKRSLAGLKKGIYQPVYYYSRNRFCRLLNKFQLVEKRPVGLFIPPSYLESFMQKNPRMFRFLDKLEIKAGGVSAFSQCGDHSYLLLKAISR